MEEYVFIAISTERSQSTRKTLKHRPLLNAIQKNKSNDSLIDLSLKLNFGHLSHYTVTLLCRSDMWPLPI